MDGRIDGFSSNLNFRTLGGSGMSSLSLSLSLPEEEEEESLLSSEWFFP